MPWNNRAFASLEQPAHKSHLTSIVGDYGCPRAFAYDQRAEPGENDDGTVRGPTALGNAVHETIYRALSKPGLRDALLRNEVQPGAESVERVVREELLAAADGRELVWRPKDGADGGKAITEKVAMVRGLLCSLHLHVAEVVALERAYIAQLGPYWISGHVDILYRPRTAPDTLAMADWKTGAQLPPQVLLDHGFESGFYSAAVRDGVWIDREALSWTRDEVAGTWTATHEPTGATHTHRSRFRVERETLEQALIATVLSFDLPTDDKGEPLPGTLAQHADYGEFPAELRYVYLADFVPYAKAGTKKPARPSQLAHYGIAAGESVKYSAGQMRGPGWYPMGRSENDMPRLESLLREVVGSVRMNRFLAMIGEKCSRCHHREPCLNSGYEPNGDNLVQLRAAFRGLPAAAGDGLD